MDGNKRYKDMKKKEKKQKQMVTDYRELAKAKWISQQGGKPKKKKVKRKRKSYEKKKSNGGGLGGIFSGIFGSAKKNTKPKKNTKLSQPKNLPNVRTIADYPREEPNKKSG